VVSSFLSLLDALPFCGALLGFSVKMIVLTNILHGLSPFLFKVLRCGGRLWASRILPKLPGEFAPELREPPDTPAGAWHRSTFSERSHGLLPPGTPRAFCFSS